MGDFVFSDNLYLKKNSIIYQKRKELQIRSNQACVLGELGAYWFLVTQSGHINGPIMLRHGMSKSRGTENKNKNKSFYIASPTFFSFTKDF
jgi:hypothetical protein